MRLAEVFFAVSAPLLACTDAPAPPGAAPATVEAQSSPSLAASPPVALSVHALPTLGPSFYGLELDLEGPAGKRITVATLQHDGPLIVSMFYASCSYACPTLIRDIVKIDRGLTPEARARTRILLVTLDPEHDTPAVLARLGEAHGVPADRWMFARARSEDATREIAAALGISFRRLPDGNYNHASKLYVLDRMGVPRASIDGLKQDPVAFIASIEAIVGASPSGR